MDNTKLVAAALSEGPEAFTPIVEKYKDAMFGVALMRVRNFHDAEDLTQEAFLEAFERLQRLRDPERLGAWLRSIVIHRCINFLKRKTLVAEASKNGHAASGLAELPATIEQQELRDQIFSAIKHLSKPQRETVALYYISGYSQQEIAAMQDVPLGTVKYRMHEARRRLKKEMIKMVEDVLKDNAPNEDFAARVFELLSCYPDRTPYAGYAKWRAMQEELKKIGTPGIDGFIKACDSPHWPTRTRAIMGLLMTNPEPVELVIELLKKGLNDSNKKVRRAAIAGLLGANVSDDRKRKEFIPLILPLYADPSKRVRRGLSQSWIMQKWLPDIPLEIIADAIRKEEDPKIVVLMQRFLLDAIDAHKGNGD